MIVCFDLDQGVQHFAGELPCARRVVWCPVIGDITLKNSGIVTVGGHSVVGSLFVGVFDHLKKTLALGLAIDSPGGIEDLVTAMSVRQRVRSDVLEKREIEIWWLDTCLSRMKKEEAGGSRGRHTRS